MDWWQALLGTIRLDQIGLGGLVVLGVVSIIRGWLSPRTVTEDLRGERDSWKQAYMESEKARNVLMSQNGELLEFARTANQILRSLPGGDDHVAQATQTVPRTRKP